MTNDLISREALIKAFEDCTGDCACCVHNTNDFKYCGLIDDAQAVPLPNEQTAWEQGYEAGLAQDKHDRPQDKWGKWVISEIRCPNCLEYFDTDCYSTEELKKCPNCGADMKDEGNNFISELSEMFESLLSEGHEDEMGESTD